MACRGRMWGHKSVPAKRLESGESSAGEAGLHAVRPLETRAGVCDVSSLENRLQLLVNEPPAAVAALLAPVLDHAAPEEVARHVRGQIDILSGGGGFVFQQVHNILANVPPQNVEAMFAAAGG